MPISSMNTPGCEITSDSVPAVQKFPSQVTKPLAAIETTDTTHTNGVCDGVMDNQKDAIAGLMGSLSLLDQSVPDVQAGKDSPEPCGPKPQLDDRNNFGRTKQRKRRPKQPKCTNLSFLDLPREIRDIIYFHVIRPDCGLGAARRARNHGYPHNHIGATKILYLNHQIHKEAMGLILAAENLLSLRDDGGRMFRNMVDFGKPLFFYGGKAPRCRLPQQYCELNLIGLRHLAIDISYPLSGNGNFLHPQTGVLERVGRSNKYDNRMAALMKSALEIEAVLWKCTSLENFRLNLQTDSTTCWEATESGNKELKYCGVTEDNHMDMLDCVFS
jgi:hypothetical protein